jgi:hypothetical protein
MAPDRAREPNTDCPVCGVFNATVTVDPAQTTLNDIVEGLLRTHLGFGEKEFVLNNEVGVLYDPDETENLPKKLIDLGKKFFGLGISFEINQTQASRTVASLLWSTRTMSNLGSTLS